MKSLKIIPLLVFVSMLSFSVRLVDVITGVSELSGSARAESKAEQTEEEKPVQAGGLVFEDDTKEEEKKEKPKKTAKKKKKPSKEKDIEWRDPGDEDPSYQEMRMEIFEELSKRRKDLDSKEKSIQTREALLKAAEQELDRKTQELSQLRGQIEKLLKTQSEEEQKRIQSLVKIYEGMKPKQAARIFDTLDLDILVQVMSLMSERKLSPILAAMNPERARTVTIMLAEQKKLPSLPQGG